VSDPIEAAARAICEADRITHAARSRWERGQARISGRYTHLRWEDLKPDIRDALVEDVRQTAADLSVGDDRITGQRAGIRWAIAWLHGRSGVADNMQARRALKQAARDLALAAKALRTEEIKED